MMAPRIETGPWEDGSVAAYEPWSDGPLVGFKCLVDGHVNYLYFNPSTEGDSPDVFVYYGPAGDPAKDEAITYVNTWVDEEPENLEAMAATRSRRRAPGAGSMEELVEQIRNARNWRDKRISIPGGYYRYAPTHNALIFYIRKTPADRGKEQVIAHNISWAEAPERAAAHAARSPKVRKFATMEGAHERQAAAAAMAPVKAVVATQVWESGWKIARWQDAEVLVGRVKDPVDTWPDSSRTFRSDAEAQEALENAIKAEMDNPDAQAIYFIEEVVPHALKVDMPVDIKQVVLYYRTPKGSWAHKRGRAVSLGAARRKMTRQLGASDDATVLRAIFGTPLPRSVQQRIRTL